MSTTTTFDPERSWGPLDERLEKESNPRRRALLEQVRDHLRTEIRGEFEPLMNTLTDHPQYHFWGLGMDVGPKSREAVSDFYRQMIADGGNDFEFEVRRLVVDDDAVVTEGVMRQVVGGEVVIESGVTEVEGEAVDSAARYVTEMQILTVWPSAGDGRLLGEDIYFGSPPMTRFIRLAEG